MKGKLRCPYISKIGIKEVVCSLHAVYRGHKKFNTDTEATQHINAVCFDNFDNCEIYQRIFIEQTLGYSRYQEQFKKHAYCCHNSGYVGLKKHNGNTHGYCQLYEKEVELYSNDICEYFNRLQTSKKLCNQIKKEC